MSRQQDEVVMYDSPEAATYRPANGITPEGWVSRHGRFFGVVDTAEGFARFDGCTHTHCPGCQAVIPKDSRCCEQCRRQWGSNAALTGHRPKE